MSEKRQIRTVAISDPSGIHLRMASAIQAIARKSRSEVVLASAIHRAKGTDIWDMLALGAPCGSEIMLEVTGPDSREVLEALEPLFTGDEEALTAAVQPAKKANN
ncbi:MAG: HPr family phosphocarrier protein [Thermoguttaceae bacterium]